MYVLVVTLYPVGFEDRARTEQLVGRVNDFGRMPDRMSRSHSHLDPGIHLHLAMLASRFPQYRRAASQVLVRRPEACLGFSDLTVHR